MLAISFHNVSKYFSLSGGRKLLRDHLSSSLTKKPRFCALRNISLQVSAGESVAVIGPNGAGKSTLLSVVTGICAPDEGEVEVNGRVAALLELGSGFHPDLTGAENLRLNASLLGLNRRQTGELLQPIVEFSGIGDFIEEPLRTYSAGMLMRLAFSIAMHVDPDILIIDEILAVGDQAFQAKCRDRILSFREARKTMLCVSHSPTELRKLCDRAIWLDHGQIMLQGDIDDVLEAYQGSARAAASTQG